MRIIIFLVLCLLTTGRSLSAELAPVAPVKPCKINVPVSTPITSECAAAAVAEAAFLENTKHKVAHYSVYPMQHSPTHWYFMIEGLLGKRKMPAPGYQWMVAVERATAKTEVTPGA